MPVALQRPHFGIQACHRLVCGAVVRSVYMPMNHETEPAFPIMKLDPGCSPLWRFADLSRMHRSRAAPSANACTCTKRMNMRRCGSLPMKEGWLDSH